MWQCYDCSWNGVIEIDAAVIEVPRLVLIGAGFTKFDSGHEGDKLYRKHF